MIKSSFQLKTIGNLLKERRQERNLTLKQISEATKIRSEYLEALEKGDYSVFPSEVYIKGFLKNYAKFLGVGSDRALALYRREAENKQGEPTIGVIAKIKEKGLNLTLTPNKIISFAVAVGFLVILVYLGTYIGRVLKKPELLITAPIAVAQDDEGSFMTTTNIVEIKGEVELGSKLKVNGQELKLNNFEEFTKEFKLEEGLNKFIITAESQFGRTSQVILNVVREEAPAVTITPTPELESPTTVPVQNIVVTIEIINKDAYIEVSTDSQQKTARVYAVGSKLEYQAKEKFEFFTPRPDAIKLTINGKAETVGNTKITWVVENGLVVRK